MTGVPPSGTVLCPRDALDATGARSVLLEICGLRYDLFVIADGEAVYGYLNACPHRGTPLETFEDRFWDTGRTRVVCSTHGARFRPEDGHCVEGPCRGKSLTGIPLELKSGLILVA